MSDNEQWAVRGEDEIRIARDEHGVPHVRARTQADLYRGLGYCHARDRGMQMLVMRTLAAGRACELLRDDDDMLAVDRFFRRMNFAGGVDEAAAELADGPRRIAEAYCDGVNDAFARGIPWELRLLGHPLEDWRLADSILVSRLAGYVALAQSQGDMERLFVEMVQAGVPTPQLEELFPGLLDGLDRELLGRVELGERIVPAEVRWSQALPHAVASNNWAISGRKTASGRCILANDPHLEADRLPAVWNEIVLELGDRYCIAATMPGLPGALVGRTNDLAWGATYTFMDAIDSWIEDCRDGCYRRVSEGTESWQPFAVRTETIKRRRHKDETVTFYENEHGVLEGDPSVPGLYLATRWASANAGSQTLATIQGMLEAPDVAAGMKLLGRIETAWNWVLADASGNIGYQMSGCMPLRSTGQNGFIPLPGWDPANDWKGTVAPEDLPRTMNPECGFIATANDDLNHFGKTDPINLPMGSYRAERIAQMLAAGDEWTTTGVRAMHMDVFSLQAERFMRILGPLLPDSANGRLLADWDYRYDPDSEAAYLFERFYRGLIVEVFSRLGGPEVIGFLMEETGILIDFYANFDRILLAPESLWYGEEGRDAVFARVAAGALAGKARRWGSHQQILMKHMLLGRRLPAFCGFDHGPLELMGNRSTIHQGQVYRLGGRETSFAPSFRFVTDFGEEVAYTCLAGGPSDRRFSRWYKSGVDDWLRGRYKPLEPGRSQPGFMNNPG